MQRHSQVPTIVPVLLLVCTLLMSLLLPQELAQGVAPSLLMLLSDPVTLLPSVALLVVVLIG